MHEHATQESEQLRGAAAAQPAAESDGRRARYRKGATILIMIASGLAAAILLFWATGNPSVEMWMFWTSTLVYLAASVLLTKAAAVLRRTRGARSLWGYALDAIYGAFFGISFVIATELPRIKLFGGFNWYSALAWLWLLAFTVFFSTYLAQRHPGHSTT
ncbi:hypothetical protein DDD64_04210 [Actinotignum sanguinis]|uniref:hypothetical protein n=1 Tax=Actinotignum sanguinis TaxID=1445614 RepID=UPI000F7D703E|nr:hypothetical protein [Actinotignum sanguinis]MDY5148000.1 hypothetical protein [Actinotignum sanguinis]RTE50036.1 hypothetical protein DDD64_04210 [Actinotignum sanguinis]